MCSFTLNKLTIGCDQLASHHSEASKSLRKDVALHISIVVFRRPHEPSRRLNGLRHHIVNKPVLVIDSCSFELGLVGSAIKSLTSTPEASVATNVSYISWKISLNRPSYFFKMVFLVDMN